jgi:hypothetical protein
MIKIGFSTNTKNPLSRFIRWVTRSQYSHCFLIVEGAFFGVDMALEADQYGFRLVPLEQFAKQHDVRLVVTPRAPLDEGVRQAAGWLGESYDFTGLFGMAFVLFGRWLHRKWKNPLRAAHAMFCSEAIVYVLQAANYPGAAELDPSGTDPEALAEFLTREPTTT